MVWLDWQSVSFGPCISDVANFCILTARVLQSENPTWDLVSESADLYLTELRRLGIEYETEQFQSDLLFAAG